MFHAIEANEIETLVYLSIYLVLDLVVFDWSIYGGKIPNNLIFFQSYLDCNIAVEVLTKCHHS